MSITKPGSGFNKKLCSVHPLVVLSALFLLFCSLPAFSQDGIGITRQEKIGPLRIAMPAADAKKLLGAPEKSTKPEFEAATGWYVRQWQYPGKGITLKISSESPSGGGSVDGITITAPCTFVTLKKIGIGSTYEQVKAAYPEKMWDPTFSNKTKIVVGSVYDGLFFDFRDGKVNSIFFGAAAE